MRLGILAVAALLAAGGCGDDGEGAVTTTSVDLPDTTAAPTTTAVVGPTEGEAACADLADRYVTQARRIFEAQGTPPDALVDRVNRRLEELDAIAVQAGCGEAYTAAVCDELDALTQEGVLVLYPLITAQCL